ncbi:zinc finger protein 3 homolog isoform X2 [Sitodiplosis mosellana]|uniref:zinc finger protein 3 homolog isoform X2 n=1 Tax=Sitodiplosis mosellana TaxID=263140 RepID=UPI0024448D4C|nr:zinc finger protein 3 homolog isoform X2 [Sitodiplosis mosellana]
MSATKRLVKIMARQGNGDIDDGDQTSSDQHEYITTVDESTDDDGSIAYITENYEMTDNTNDDDDAFFVEYVTEEEENPITGENNETEFEANQYAEYAEDDEMTDELYNCNLCGMNFKSITEHVEKYHSGQDVLIDISEESGSAIKAEQDDDPLDIQENEDEGGSLITGSDNDGEFVVFGDESIDNDTELLEELSEEDDQEVYTYDGTTGSLTRAINMKGGKRLKVTANKTNKETYSCQRCDAVFGSLKALCSHKLSMHEKEITGTNKPTRRLVKAAIRVKDNDTAKGSDHVCETCNTTFYSAKSLKLHARMHLPVKSKTIDEATEQETDNSTGGDQDHRREKFYCAICGKSYDKNFEQVHVQMHNGEEKFNCSICNKVFPNEESIQMHMNAHQDTRVIRTKAEMSNIKLPYGCQYCGKEFARPHEKVKHERVHTGEKPYECELCGKCFRVSYCLTIHMRTHTDARPYVCPQCNKRFKAQSVYNHHLLTHSDERNYKCPYCPKTFKTSVQLSGHKNSHTKPFTCTECNRPFGSLYAVRAHMESHKRPNHNLKHICDICGAKYARRFALNDHIKEQHKDVQLVIVDSNSGKKSQAKRTKKVKQIEILEDDDERELEAAGQSILPNMVEQEITISEIEHFDNEEEVVEMDDWLK